MSIQPLPSCRYRIRTPSKTPQAEFSNSHGTRLDFRALIPFRSASPVWGELPSNYGPVLSWAFFLSRVFPLPVIVPGFPETSLFGVCQVFGFLGPNSASLHPGIPQREGWLGSEEPADPHEVFTQQRSYQFGFTLRPGISSGVSGVRLRPLRCSP